MSVRKDKAYVKVINGHTWNWDYIGDTVFESNRMTFEEDNGTLDDVFGYISYLKDDKMYYASIQKYNYTEDKDDVIEEEVFNTSNIDIAQKWVENKIRKNYLYK